MKKFLFVISLPLFAGQDIQLSTQSVGAPVPAPMAHTTWRVESVWDGWGTFSGVLNPDQWDSGTFQATILSTTPTSIYAQLFDATDNGGACVASLTGLPSNHLKWRFQHDGIGGTFTSGMADLCQAWDSNGNIVVNSLITFTTDSAYPYSGVILNGLGASSNLSHAYFRIFNTLVPSTSTPPVTDAPTTGCLVYAKFDGGNNTGSLSDSCGVGPYNFSGASPSSLGSSCSASGATPAYCNTPFQIPYAVACAPLQCSSALGWSSAIPSSFSAGSCNAGQTCYVDLSDSYSDADGSPTVTGALALNSGPSTPSVSFSGLLASLGNTIFGDYNFTATVTDVNSNIASASIDVGSVSKDSNGVVISSNTCPAAYLATCQTIVSELFGPLIGWGNNPWGYQDQGHLNYMLARDADYAYPVVTQGLTYPGWSTNNNKPQWEVPGAGTVSYYFNGVGNESYLNSNCSNPSAGSPCGTTINQFGGITPSTTSFVVTAASGLDLTSLPVAPTRIIVYDGSNLDELRVCSASGNTLNLCYDPSALPRHSFLNGTNILQAKLSGTSTHFISDANSPIAPLEASGQPSLPGLSTYSMGTVSLSAGSAVATISSGTWTSDGIATNESLTGGNFDPGNFLQVQATHSTAPFTFMAQNITGGAYAIASLSGGAISAVTPFASLIGNNYIVGHVNVVVSDSTGSGANITANVVAGQVTSYTVVSGGANYTNPTLFLSPTQVTLARIFPSDADTASSLFYYVMPATRTTVLHYKNLWTDPVYDAVGDSMLMFGTTGCESETTCYLNPIGLCINTVTYSQEPCSTSGAVTVFGLGASFTGGHDISGMDGTFQSGNPYSITDTTGWVNQGATGGIDFYGEEIASLAGWLRSGLSAFKNAHEVIADYWIHSPWGNPDGNGFPRLFLGGAAIGAWMSYLTDASSLVTISNLRGYANLGIGMVNGIAANGCNAWDDTRDSGYAYAWLILAAIFDPDTSSTSAPGGLSWRAYWQSFLGQMQTNDNNCANQTGAANATYAFANGFVWNAGQPALTMTNGSAAATGTGIPSSLCNGVASGTATITAGSNTLTVLMGSLPNGVTPPQLGCAGNSCANIFLTGTTGGGSSVFVQSLPYTGSSTATLGGYWMGDSATSGNPVSWVAGNWNGNPGSGVAQDMLTIATSNNDLTNLQKNWACTWNSSTSITLNRPWDGPSTDGTHIYHPYVSNLAGYGAQPFTLGIKSYGMNLLASQNVAALAAYKAPYSTFTVGSTSWIWNNGMDHQFFGTNYGRIFPQCEPTNYAPIYDGLGGAATAFDWRAPGCTYGGDQYIFLSTEQNSETGAAHTIYYANNRSPSNLTLGDEFYGSLWGINNSWTTGGVYNSASSTASNAAQSNLFPVKNVPGSEGGKWYGFFYGMGFSSRWPATRLTSAPPTARPLMLSGSSSGVSVQ